MSSTSRTVLAILPIFAIVTITTILSTWSRPVTGQEPNSYQTIGTIERLDPRFDKLIARDAVVEKLSG